jgi:hypothetical protein
VNGNGGIGRKLFQEKLLTVCEDRKHSLPECEETLTEKTTEHNEQGRRKHFEMKLIRLTDCLKRYYIC